MIDCSEFTQGFFDEASKAWKKNKVRKGEAMYRYKKNAFPPVEEPPVPKLSLQQKKALAKELMNRQDTDEYAPPRTRRSPRLREKEVNS